MKFNQFIKYISGDKHSSIEEKIFNIVSFSIAVFAIIGTLANYSIGLNFGVITLSIIGILVSSVLFYFSRFRKLYSYKLLILYFIAVTIILGIMYFYNGGIHGTILYLILMFLNIFVLITRSKYHFRIYFFYLLLLYVLLFLSYYYKDWVIPYKSLEENYIDHAVTMFYTLLMSTVIISIFRTKMYDDHRMIVEKNNELSDLYHKMHLQSDSLRQTTEDLKIALIKTEERNLYIEALLRELSHRVKNNLQLVVSLLDMQFMNEKNSKIRESINETKNRLISMMLAHQDLYHFQNSTTIELRSYLKKLVNSIQNSYLDDDDTISLQSMEIILPVEQIIPIGLIVNEVITNAFKHAFAKEKKPYILVKCEIKDNTLCIAITDNGIGFNSDQIISGIGTNIIKLLTRQLNGNYHYGKFHNNYGTIFSLNIPLKPN